MKKERDKNERKKTEKMSDLNTSTTVR